MSGNESISIYFAVLFAISFNKTVCNEATESGFSHSNDDFSYTSQELWAHKPLKSLISNNIVYGTPLSYSMKQDLVTPVDEYVIASAEKRTNDVYMIDATTNEELKIKDFIEKSKHLAAELQDLLGCDKNTILGIISENRHEVPIVILAALITGATFTAYNPLYGRDELKIVYNIAKPTIIFCSAEFCTKIRELAPATSKFIVFDSKHSLPDVLQFSQLIDSGSTKVLRKVIKEPNDIACISYSSGTTGLPKGVVFTHSNIMYGIIFQRESLAKNGPRTLIITPMGIYTTGFTPCLSGVIRNETIITTRKPDMVSFLSTIEKYKIRRLLIYTGIMTFLLKDPLVDKYDLSSVEIVYCGGAIIAAETEKAFIDKFKVKYFQQVYGLTEASWATIKHPQSPKLGSCGAPSLGIELKIIDQETGNSLGSKQSGELYIRGPNVIKGFYNNDEATALTIDQEGWFHSGDIAYYDDDGEFYIVGRSKELIKVGSWPVPPAELEAILLEHPSIADAAVIGVPHEYYSEVPRAYIVIREGENLKEDDVIQYMAKKVVECKRLAGGVEFISKIPRSPANGKIIRDEVKRLWIERSKQNKQK